MAIVQISKIIHRVGAQIDLPQLDTGEIGFASDSNKVYIGNDPIIHPPSDPSQTTQTELLTDSSTLAFSQLGGASGTSLNLSNVQTGQLLVANADVWTNAGGNAGGLITLGTASNVKITGGIGGYVLQTDGAGNLSWTTNGVVKNDIANIAYLANHTLDNQGAVLVTTKLPHLFATGSAVTIMNVSDSSIQQALSDSGVGGENSSTGVYHATNRYYVRRLSDTTFSLYTDSDAVTNPVNGTGWTDGTYTANTGYALGFVPATTVPGAGGTPGGSNTQVQFNNAGHGFAGSNNFTFNRTTNTLNVNGNITATYFIGDGSQLTGFPVPYSNSNVDAYLPTYTGNITGNIITLTGNITATNASLGNLVAANYFSGDGNLLGNIVGSNVSGAVAFATTANSVAGSNVSGEVSFAAVANSVAGANVSGAVAFSAIANSVAGSNVSGQVANALIAATVYSSAQPAITSLGDLVSLTVIGNITTANIITANTIKSSNIELSFDNGANTFTMFANATGIFATNNITNTTYAVALTPV